MKTLEELDVADDTLVIFSSDNGPEVPTIYHMRHDHAHDGARPWRGVKRDNWEGGHRVPMLVRWPGKIKPGTVCDEPWISLDLCSLCLELAGLSRPTDRTLDGANPLPMLTESAPSAHEFLAFAYRKYQAIRIGDFKLIKPPKQSDWQLYHLKTDIGEKYDLAAEHPERVRAMRQRFNQWLESTQHD